MSVSVVQSVPNATCSATDSSRHTCVEVAEKLGRVDPEGEPFKAVWCCSLKLAPAVLAAANVWACHPEPPKCKQSVASTTSAISPLKATPPSAPGTAATPGTTPSPASGNPLREEVRQLDAVRNVISEGNIPRAQRLLRQYFETFPCGILLREAKLLKASLSQKH